MFDTLPVEVSVLRGSGEAAPFVDAAVGWARMAAKSQAQRLACIAEWAAFYLTESGEDDGCLCAVEDDDDVVAQIGIAFGVSVRWAMNDLQIGAAMKERFPRLAALFLEGEISATVMATVVERTILVWDADALAAIDAACVEAARAAGWSGLSKYTLKNAVDVWVERHDPAAVRRARQTQQNRCVSAGSPHDASGTTSLFCRLTTPGAALVMGRLRRMAAAVCNDDPRTMDQKLADALEALGADADHLRCLCGSTECPAATDDGVGARFVIHVYTDADALTGETDPGIHGDGPVEGPPMNVTLTPKNSPATHADEAAEAPDETASEESAAEAEQVPEAATAPAGAESSRPDAATETAPDESAPKDAAAEDESTPRQSPGPAAPESDRVAEAPVDAEAPAPAPVDESAVEAASADEADHVAAEHSATAKPAAEATESAPQPHHTNPSPGFVPGYGVIPNTMLAALIAAGAKVRHVKPPGVNPEQRYRPSHALREFVLARDLTCRVPGCDRAAVWGDLDHSIAWADGGVTHASNLHGKCRHHHLIKTFRDGWSEVQSPDGALCITTPTGHSYTSIPTSRLLFPRACTTSAPVQRGSPRTLPPEDTTAGMPTRRRSKAKDRAYRIAAERVLNEAYLAAQKKPDF